MHLIIFDQLIGISLACPTCKTSCCTGLSDDVANGAGRSHTVDVWCLTLWEHSREEVRHIVSLLVPKQVVTSCDINIYDQCMRWTTSLPAP